MRRKIVLTAVLVSIAPLCRGTTCTSGTLFSYIGLGTGGCTVGSSTFSGFQLLSGTTGAAEISAANVMLTPLGSSTGPGLTTAVRVTSAATVNESLFTYQISGAPYTSLGITISNASETGGGAVTGLADFCLGGAFSPDGVSGCSGLSGGLATVDGAQNQDSASFGAATLISVTNDLTIDGGVFGSATGGTLLDQFGTSSTATPEPISVLFTGGGLLLLAVRRFKFTINRSVTKGKKQ